MDNGYFIIARKMMKWEWSSEPLMMHSFVWFIHLANWQEKRWKGIVIPRGSFVSSRAHLSKTLGVSQQQLRTVCQRLKSTSEITSKSTSRYTMYTVVKYDYYQTLDNYYPNQSTNKSTNEQPAINQQSTTTEDNKEKKESKEKVSKDTQSSSEKFQWVLFGRFWNEYPVRIGIEASKNVWKRLKPTEALVVKMIAAIHHQKKSTKWQDKIIPSPAKWLAEGRWEDEVTLAWEYSNDERGNGTGNTDPF